MSIRGRARRLAQRVRGRLHWLRVQEPVSAALGPQYRRARDLVEIDITWACNLRCFNCNRSCEQAPTGEGMSVDQIRHFVEESVAAGKQWRRIRILGGEPTLHPDFLEILEILRAWRAGHAPGAILEVATNGHGDKVAAMVAQIPADVVVENTDKAGPEQPFLSFNVAPRDLQRYRLADYKNACWVSENCGIGLTAAGWYPCAVAGGIDRITGWDLGRKSLPADEDALYDQLEAFCAGCGGFKREWERPVQQPVQSLWWREAYERWRGRDWALTPYGPQPR